MGGAGELRVRPGPGLSYAGAFDLELDGIALAERQHWVDARDGVVIRLLVVQLERYLPGAEGAYAYAPRSGRARREDVRALGVRARGRGRAGGAREACDRRIPQSKGYSVPGRHAVARFARIAGADRRGEVIVFVHGCGPGAVLDGILERAREAFEVV